ncbi:MAG: hypothetical protein Q9M13_05300 [Mariprofundales bacterium]|nr:hypothetical protein [Mariprofundales bacterium]
MQSLSHSDEGVTITRAASQQMMHLSLTYAAEHSTPICGIAHLNKANCITHIELSTKGADQTGDHHTIWISHSGATEQQLISLCRSGDSGGYNAPFLLLNLANRGRMDLQAARLNQHSQQLQPVAITMVEEE